MKINKKQETRNKRQEIDIDYVAKLANLDLSGEEKKVFGKQLPQILGYINQIKQVKTPSTGLRFSVATTQSVMREDKVGKSLSQKETLSNATSTKNGQFATKGIFENEDI